MHRSPLVVALIAVLAASQIAVGLWDYRDAPDSVRLAVVLGAVSMALLGILGLALLKRR